MAITNLDQLISGFGPPYNFIKVGATTEGAGTFHSAWRLQGSPTSGAVPPTYSGGSGYIPDNNTTGAISYTYPSVGSLYLARFACGNTVVSNIFLYDRLWHCGGLSMATTGLQTVISGGLIPARDMNGTSSGIGVEIWGEIYSAGGATAATWSVTYTNENGVTGRRATYAHPNNAETLGQMFPFMLTTGDKGVQSIQSVTTSNTATAGNLGITLVRRIASIPTVVIGQFGVQDAISLGLPQIYSGSCLAFMYLCSTTTVGTALGSLNFASG